MPEAILPKSPLVASIPNAAFPTAGLGLSLDLNGRLPQAILQTLPGYEFAYNEFIAPVSVTATTEATATTIVTASAVTFDGSTSVWIEFSAPDVSPDNAAAGRRIIFTLYDGASSIGLLGVGPYSQVVGNSADVPMRLARKLTPVAASKTYSVRGFASAGTTIVSAGAGGAGNAMPGFIRVTKA